MGLKQQTEEIGRALMREGSHNRLPALLDETLLAPDAVFWRVFLHWWGDCDRTWEHQEILLCELRVRRAAAFSPAESSSAADKKFFRKLPDPVTVYRGCSRERIDGLSWTVDLEVARGFARGHRFIPVPDPVVAKSTIGKAHIFAVFNTRKEGEVLLDPDELADMEVSDFLDGPVF